MQAFSPASIRPMREDDLERVLAWRNHADVRSHMLQSREIGRDEHRHWFDAASRDPSRCLLVVDEGPAAIGFVQYSSVAPGGIAIWGFYAAPGAPRGSGRNLGTLGLAYGFQTLLLHKVCGEVLADNQSSLGFHKSMGFREEGVLREQHKVGESYMDVVRFGLLRREWSVGIES